MSEGVGKYGELLIVNYKSLAIGKRDFWYNKARNVFSCSRVSTVLFLYHFESNEMIEEKKKKLDENYKRIL